MTGRTTALLPAPFIFTKPSYPTIGGTMSYYEGIAAAGAGLPARSPYDLTTEAGQDWLHGYRDHERAIRRQATRRMVEALAEAEEAAERRSQTLNRDQLL